MLLPDGQAADETGLAERHQSAVRRAAATSAAWQELVTERTLLQERLSQLQEQASAALMRGQNDLVREALLRKRETVDGLVALAEQLVAAEQQRDEAMQGEQELRQQIEAHTRRQEYLRTMQETAAAQARSRAILARAGAVASDAAVESELRRLKAEITGER